jgi:hypothetical protein
MKQWPWRKILAIVGSCLVVVGILPLAYCFWFEYAPRPEPFFMQFPPQKGEYTLSPFAASFRRPFKIDLEWHRTIPEDKKIWLDMDWKIVDEKGGTVAKGAYHYWIVGNMAVLAGYPSGYRKGQRIVMTLPRDVPGEDESMRLKISVDEAEMGLDMSYAAVPAVFSAGIIAGPGLLLIFLGVRKGRSNLTSPSTP